MKFRLVESITTEYDSDGNQLTPEQSQFFMNSEIRDSQGKLLVCYHGTESEFSEFNKRLNFFTADKNYSMRYSKFDDSKVLKCYLNITNPFTLTNSTCKNIFINKYIKGGNAQGINPYSTDKEINNYIQNGVDWVEADNLLDFLEEEGYTEFDGLILNEGGDLNNDGTVVMRGDSFVAFNPNQIKLVSNLNPTDSNDINEDVLDEDVLDEAANDFAYTTREFEQILKYNGYEYNRSRGDHNTYTKPGCNPITVTAGKKHPNVMILRRLIKENNLEIPEKLKRRK